MEDGEDNDSLASNAVVHAIREAMGGYDSNIADFDRITIGVFQDSL